MRSLTLTLTTALVWALSGAATAQEPATGTITAEETMVEFTGGPHVAANVFGQAGDPECIDPVFPCDNFLLTVDLPDDYVQNFPSAIIRFIIAVDSPGANAREDYDVYLYDASGNLVAESASETDPESLGILAENGESQFELQVVPFTATGSTYIGTIELIPGEPANPTTEARSLERGGSAGGLGALVVLLGLLGLRRRV